MKFELYHPLAIHEIGKRDNQEDSIYPLLGEATEQDRLFIVCDGMGGHEHGEVASQTFSQGVAEYFEKVSADNVLDDETLKDAIEYAYRKLDIKDDGALKKMGTTLTLLYMHRGGVTCAHIGDSRIYHIRPGKGLLYVSRDHSLVFDLYQSGEISYDEMKTSPQKNIITRAIQPGVDNRVRADIIHITDVRPEDYFYLCSDGMLEQMENEELSMLLSSDASDEKKRQKLIAETVDNKDNHSAYIIHVKSVTAEADDERFINEEPTARCNALNIRPAILGKDAPDDNSGDVEVVHDTHVNIAQQKKHVTKTSNKNRLFWPIVFFASLLVIGFVVYSFIGNDKEKSDIESTFNVPEDVSDKDMPEAQQQKIISHSPSNEQEKASPHEKQTDKKVLNEKSTKEDKPSSTPKEDDKTTSAKSEKPQQAEDTEKPADDNINHGQSANSPNDSKDKIRILKDGYGKKNAEPHIEADNIKE